MPPGFAERPAAGRIGVPMDGGQDGGGVQPADGSWLSLDEGELYRLWRDATGESIGGDLARVRILAGEIHPSHRPLLQYWTQAMEQLEHWLRDR